MFSNRVLIMKYSKKLLRCICLFPSVGKFQAGLLEVKLQIFIDQNCSRINISKKFNILSCMPFLIVVRAMIPPSSDLFLEITISFVVSFIYLILFFLCMLMPLPESLCVQSLSSSNSSKRLQITILLLQASFVFTGKMVLILFVY